MHIMTNASRESSSAHLPTASLTGGDDRWEDFCNELFNDAPVAAVYVVLGFIYSWNVNSSQRQSALVCGVYL